jgi:hypothetical protein
VVQQKKGISLLFFFLMHAGALHGILRGRTFFSPRPQGAYLSHAISGYQPNFMRLHDKDDACASTHRFSLAGHYQRLYRGEHRAEYYFGTECLTFSGSRVDGRGRDDILADYFGLSTDFKSIVQFKPTISTGSVEFGFDYWNVGSSDGKEWYLRVRAPLVVTAWDMGLCEHAREEGENNYPAGYMSSELIEHSGLNTSVREAWAGERAIGDIQPLRYGKLRGEQKETALADITVDLGVRPVYDDEYYFGMHARVVAPTGTRPQGCYLFEPVAGNGRHWELGFGLQGFALLHEDEVGSHRFELYGEMNITCSSKNWEHQLWKGILMIMM